MEYVMRRADPGKSVVRVGAVVALHVVLAYGLIHGMNRRPGDPPPPPPIDYVNIIPQPPKPPEPVRTVPLKFSQPVPTRVDVPILQPVVADTISVPIVAPPSQDTASTGYTSSDSAPTTVSTGVTTACPNSQAIRSNLRYPMQARRDGIEGDVVARFVVGARGEIRDIAIISSGNRMLNSTVIGAVQQFQCVGQGRDVTVEVPFAFRLQ